MDTFRVTHPLEKDADMGALVDKSQFDTISGWLVDCRYRETLFVCLFVCLLVYLFMHVTLFLYFSSHTFNKKRNEMK